MYLVTTPVEERTIFLRHKFGLFHLKGKQMNELITQLIIKQTFFQFTYQQPTYRQIDLTYSSV